VIKECASTIKLRDRGASLKEKVNIVWNFGQPQKIFFVVALVQGRGKGRGEENNLVRFDDPPKT
jgi:hypothetical protein